MFSRVFKRFLSITRFIWNHPLASKNRLKSFFKFFEWQISQFLYPHTVKYHFIENSYLLQKKGLVGATGNIYTGLVEFNDMSFLLHLLREGDLFADVGANVGVYTVLASKICRANTYAFEPIEAAFRFLIKNIEINEIKDLVKPIQKGVGKQEEKLFFTRRLDTVNHVVYEKKGIGNYVETSITSLDITFKDIIPVLIKIDVEGFEWNVLQGADHIIQSSELKAMIIELNGSGKRYGFSDEQIHSFLISRGFFPFSYEPFSRKLTRLQTYGRFNTIYIKDLNWVGARLNTARLFKVFGENF